MQIRGCGQFCIFIFWRISVTGGCTAEWDVISSSTHAGEFTIDAIASSVACTVAEIRRCGQFCISIFWRISVTGGCTAELDVIPSSTHAENSIDAIAQHIRRCGQFCRFWRISVTGGCTAELDVIPIASSVACTVAEIRRCGQFCISIFWRISVTGGCTASRTLYLAQHMLRIPIDAIASSVACTVAEIPEMWAVLHFHILAYLRNGRLHGRVGRYI